MSGLDDLVQGAQSGGSSPGGLGDLLGGVLGAGGGGGLGSILGQVLRGGGAGSGGGALGGVIGALLPTVIGMLAGGGFGKVLGGLRANGLAAQADSWIGTGENEPIGADDVMRALGPDQMEEVAARLGMSREQAAEALAEALPTTIDHLTPDGRVPDDGELEGSLDALRSRFS